MKKKTTAIILSGLVFPGAGQIYLRRYVRGAALIAAALAVVGAVVYKTLVLSLDLVLTIPQEEMAGGLMPLATKVLESARGFYNACAVGLLVVWAAGVIDAYIAGEE
jgi:TM2 domain-containing membrane protein YozV